MDIYGGIPALGIANGTDLFAASFVDGTFAVTGTTGTFTGQLNLTSIYLNSSLGTYTFVSGSTVETSLNLNINCQNGGLCSGLVDPTLQLQTPVPEPGSLSLLCAGLVTFGARFIRRKVSP